MSNDRLPGRRRRRRVAIIHHGFIPIYRAGFYERLASASDIEYVVYHGPAPQGTGHVAAEAPFGFADVRVPNRELRLGGKTLIYQPLIASVLRGGFDAVVMVGQLRFVSNVMLHPLFKASRQGPVVVWIQGTEKAQEGDGAVALINAVNPWFRALFARTADHVFAYSRGGARALVASGVRPERVSVVPNTIDTDQQIEVHRSLNGLDPADLRAELGLRPDSHVLLFVGRLYPEKRVSELLAAYRTIKERGLAERPIELVIVGDGPDFATLSAEAESLGGDVHLPGAIHDVERMARYMRVAAALVIPGGVGLAADHAFAQGLPLITRESPFHGPEIEYVEHMRNGMIVSGDDDRFAEAIADYLGSPGRQQELAQGALETRESLSLAAMVDAFDTGVAKVLARR